MRRSIFVLLLVVVAINHAKSQYDCNVCQNHPRGQRWLTNPNHQFTMSNGKKWTCQELQDVVQDVRPSSNAQEARHCLDHQVIAELNGCQCNGPSVQSLLNGPFKDKNPSCSLCTKGDFSYVPAFRIDSTVRIPNAGTLNCGGLFSAALTGNVLNKNQCASWTPIFSRECCSLPTANDIGYNNDNGPSPTKRPTPRPTPHPTPNPTPEPTPAPTGVCRSGKAELIVEIQTDKYPDDTSWSLKRRSSGQTIDSGNNYKRANTQYMKSVCVKEGEEYTLTVHDSYGDGVCCAWGNGWYKATLNGKEIARGASFGSKVETVFVVPTGGRRQLRKGGA